MKFWLLKFIYYGFMLEWSSMFEIVVVVAVQSAFRLEMHQNEVFFIF
jgi:hypothetical protein